MRAGLLIVLAGIAGMVLVLQPAVPVAEGLAAWTVAAPGHGAGVRAAVADDAARRRRPGGKGGHRRR